MRSKARYLLLAATIPMIAGCGVYLHDAQLETATGELKTSFDGLQAPTMLAELKASEAQFAGDEDRALLNYGVSARNAALSGFIRAPSRNRASAECAPRQLPLSPCLQPGLPAFRAQVEHELDRVYGAHGPTAALNQLINAPEITAAALREQGHLLAEVADARQGFIRARGAHDTRPTDCERVPPPSQPQPTDPIDLFYHSLQIDCEALRNLAFPADTASASSELGSVRQALENAHARLAANQAQAKALTDAIEALEQKADQQGTLATLDAEIKQVQRLLDEAQPYARLAGLERLSPLIENLLALELNSEQGEAEAGAAAAPADPSPTAVKGAAALQLLRAIATTADAFAAQPRSARTNELLLAAAHVRHDIRMAQLDVATDRAEIQNLEAQQVALSIKAAHYARAQLIISQGRLGNAADFTELRNDPARRAAAGEVLAAYVGAWNHGEIPYRVLQFRQIQVRRAAAIERATLTEADYRTSLKPVFDQLAAYGAGGVRPEAIGELLGQLGIAGAILGR